MAAYEVLLLNTAIPQIQAAQSGDTYLVPRDIAFSAALTLSAGTAYGVPYLSASKVLTTGSTLVFDGSILGVGAAATANYGNFQVTGGVQSSLFSQLGTDTIRMGVRASGRTGIVFDSSNATYTNRMWYIDNQGSAGSLVIGRQGLDVLTMDNSGNLGLGVTPSAWFSGVRVLQFGTAGVLFSNSDRANLASNVYIDSGTVSKYIGDGFALRYAQENGQHVWYNAPSGTAGNAIFFTQAMTLDALGNLGVGTTSIAAVTGFSSSRVVEQIGGVSGYGQLRLGNDAGTMLDHDNSGTTTTTLRNLYGASSTSALMQIQSGYITFGTGTSYTERARITSGGIFQVSSGGSVQVGGTAARATTAGTNRLDIFNGTAPVGTLTDGISIYSSSGEAYVMDAAGNATLFSPHDAETNEWIFKSKHTPTGKVLKIDVERLLKFVNDHFGLDAVHEFVEE